MTELRSLLNTLRSARVSALAGPARPNYVLHHDSRYRPLWDVYVKLVRQQLQQDEAWIWRHRIWAESCMVGLLWAMETIASASRYDRLRCDALVRQEQVSGRFIDKRTCLAPWCSSQGTYGDSIDFVANEDLTPHPSVPTALARLSPDFVFVRRRGAAQSPMALLAFWTVLDFDIGGNALRRRTESLGKRLSGLPHPIYRGVLLQPRLGNGTGVTSSGDLCRAGGCTGYRLPVSIQQQDDLLKQLLASGLFG